MTQLTSLRYRQFIISGQDHNPYEELSTKRQIYCIFKCTTTDEGVSITGASHAAGAPAPA